MGEPLRLPTEAEWEKAASWDPTVGEKRVYPWGDEWDSALVNADWPVIGFKSEQEGLEDVFMAVTEGGLE